MKLEELKKKALSRKQRPVELATSLELGIIVGLISYTDEKCEGWMTMKEILSDKGTDGRPLFKSPSSCFTTIIKQLINKGLVETSIEPYSDDRLRRHSRKIFRLKRDGQTKYNVYGLIMGSWSYDESRKGKSLKSMLSINIPKILSRPYFRGLDDEYDKILDGRIRKLKHKIALYESIKHTRGLKKLKTKGG